MAKWPTGPYSVSAGSLQIANPAVSRDALAGALFENNSQYLLQVGVDSQFVQPFSSKWLSGPELNPSNQTVIATVFGSQPIASSGQVLTVTFYSADEEPPVIVPFAADPITVAQAMAQIGLPNVLLTTKLFSSTSAAPLAAQQSADLATVGSYASLTITTRDINSGANQPTNLKLEWYLEVDANGNPVGVPALTEYLTNIVGLGPDGAWAVPVSGQFLRITNARALGGHGVAAKVVGSNRTVPRSMQLGSSYTTRQFGKTAFVTASGVLVVLDPTDGGEAATKLTGQAYVRFACSGASGGLLGFQWLSPNNTQLQTYVEPSVAAGGSIVSMVPHPLSVVSWVILPVAPFGATNYSLDITQV